MPKYVEKIASNVSSAASNLTDSKKKNISSNTCDAHTTPIPIPFGGFPRDGCLEKIDGNTKVPRQSYTACGSKFSSNSKKAVPGSQRSSKTGGSSRAQRSLQQKDLIEVYRLTIIALFYYFSFTKWSSDSGQLCQ